MNFNVADATPEDPLNRILWHSIKGDDTPYPGIVGGASTGTNGNSDG